MATQPVREPVLHAMYDQVAAGLLEAGFRPDDAMAIVTATESFILGSALDAAAPGVMFNEIHDDLTPHLAQIVQAAAAERADQAFELGMHALTEGYRTLLARQPEPAELFAAASPERDSPPNRPLDERKCLVGAGVVRSLARQLRSVSNVINRTVSVDPTQRLGRFVGLDLH